MDPGIGLEMETMCQIEPILGQPGVVPDGFILTLVACPFVRDSGLLDGLCDANAAREASQT